MGLGASEPLAESAPSGSRLLGPGTVQDHLDEVDAPEARHEVGQHIGIHGAEGCVRPVLEAVSEGVQNPALEVGSRVRIGDGFE